MTQTECMKTPLAATASHLNDNQSNYFEFQQQQGQQHSQSQQQQQHYIVSSTINDPFATYADNFDLSLLPQDCANAATATTATTTTTATTHNPCDVTRNHHNIDIDIPTTVFNFDPSIPEKQKPQSSGVPEIKIEQTWSSCPSLNTIKQEQIYQSYFPFNTQQNQLIPPPPAYPTHIYPSPQSSPAQSEYGYPQTQYSGCYESLSSSRNSIYASVTSPCPSIDVHTIKQEQLHILPPSPPESNCDTPTPQSGCSISGFDFKSEPIDSDAEAFTELNVPSKAPLTSKKATPVATLKSNLAATQNHKVLRDYLEDSTSHKLHNLKPLALDSFIGGLEEVRDNFEPVISLALEHAKREADATCAKLQISQNPSNWSAVQVHAWLRTTLQQFDLPAIDALDTKFSENGATLLQLSEEEFTRRIPEGGSILHAQLEIWKLTFSDDSSQCATDSYIQTHNWMYGNTMSVTLKDEMEEDTEDENDFLPDNKGTTGFLTNTECNNGNSQFAGNDSVLTNAADVPGVVGPAAVTVKRAGNRNGGSHIHLWQFLKELLAAPQVNGTAIRWIDRTRGIFKIEDSVRVAKLWGKRKNRPAMNYDKLSRSIRQYYKKGIMKKTERSQRLVYQFCQPYHI